MLSTFFKFELIDQFSFLTGLPQPPRIAWAQWPPYPPLPMGLLLKLPHYLHTPDRTEPRQHGFQFCTPNAPPHLFLHSPPTTPSNSVSTQSPALPLHVGPGFFDGQAILVTCAQYLSKPPPPLDPLILASCNLNLHIDIIQHTPSTCSALHF